MILHRDSTPVTARRTLPDILAKELRVVFCGINPGMRAAASGHHFMGGGNRFWRVLHLAGFTPVQLLPENDRDLLQYQCGLTTVVERPTVRASDVAKDEFRAASPSLAEKIRRYEPLHLAFLGKAGVSAIYTNREVRWGRQDFLFEGAVTWVLPNPSGLNRSFSLDELTVCYRLLRVAAFPSI